jgi:hypothetical protein
MGLWKDFFQHIDGFCMYYVACGGILVLMRKERWIGMKIVKVLAFN